MNGKSAKPEAPEPKRQKSKGRVALLRRHVMSGADHIVGLCHVDARERYIRPVGFLRVDPHRAEVD